jgi:hypothetical protein
MVRFARLEFVKHSVLPDTLVDLQPDTLLLLSRSNEEYLAAGQRADSACGRPKEQALNVKLCENM